MSVVSGQKYSKTFIGQQNGTTFKVACKFAYAGGMAVTETFSYTVGSNCGIIPGAPTLTATALATSLTSTSAVSGGTITVAGTSSVTARGVCWSTEPKPTVELLTKTVDGTGIGTFTSNISGLIPGVKYYVRAYATNNEGTNYGSEITLVAPDTEMPTNFTASSGNPLSTSIPFYLNATDNSGSVVYTISYGYPVTVLTVNGISGTEINSLVENLSPGTNYSFKIKAKDATGNSAANSPINITVTTKPGVTSAPIPTKDINTVVSIFSDTYNSIGGTLFNPLGAQNTVVSMPQISGNTTLKYSYFDSEETELGSDLDFISIGASNIHFDVWSENETSLKFYLTNRNPLSESGYEVPVVIKEEWNSYDIPIEEFTSQSEFTPNSIYKFRIEGSGNNGEALKTVYIDNIFLWGLPTSIYPVRDNNILCYPNPVKAKLFVISKSEISQIVIRNLLGQTVESVTGNEFERSIDLRNLSVGNYFITIRLVDGQLFTKKIYKL